MNLGYIAYEDKLNKEYREAFDIVEAYGSANNIDAEVGGEWLMELLDSMLEAQEAGEPVEKIVGTDIDRFCMDFYSRYTLKDRIQGTFRWIYGMAKFLFVLELIDGLILMDEEPFFTGGSGVLFPYMCGVACGMITVLLINIILNPLFLKKKLSVKIYDRITAVVSIVSIIAAVITVGIMDDRLDIIFPRYILLAVLGVYIIIYAVMRAVKNYRKYGTVREPKVEKITMKDMINANLETELPKTWLKQFEKKNKKREKKGKQPFTNEEFMDKLTKRYDYRRKKITTIASTIGGGLFGAGLVMVLDALGILSGEANTDFFESGLDAVFFFLMIICICLLVALFLAGLSKSDCEIFAAMKKECDENGWTIAEYVENLENMKSTESTVSAESMKSMKSMKSMESR
ncbi:MAG: hypothetical protein IJV15_00440 [Lachnospiraceae bacterium]|nr:hypothetical protein [Lachnospiraceae bacterium]